MRGSSDQTKTPSHKLNPIGIHQSSLGSAYTSINRESSLIGGQYVYNPSKDELTINENRAYPRQTSLKQIPDKSSAERSSEVIFQRI